MKLILCVLLLAVLYCRAIHPCYATDPSLVMSVVGFDKSDNPVITAAGTCVDSNCPRMICDIGAAVNVTHVLAVPMQCQNCDKLRDKGDDIEVVYRLNIKRSPDQILWCGDHGCSQDFCYQCDRYGATLESIGIVDAYCFPG